MKLIMKKVLLMAAFAVASLAANAQAYIGGSLGFSNNKTKTGTTTVTENTNPTFTIAPEVGYALNEKWGIGIKLGFTSSNTKSEMTAAGLTATSEDKTTRLSVNPYVRYQALEIGKFNVFVDGGVYFNMNSRKQTATGVPDTEYEPAMGFGLNVTPGVSYKLTDKLSVVATANNLFRFGYTKSMVAKGVNGAPTPDAPTSIDANLNTLDNFSLGNLMFGFYYNF